MGSCLAWLPFCGPQRRVSFLHHYNLCKCFSLWIYLIMSPTSTLLLGLTGYSAFEEEEEEEGLSSVVDHSEGARFMPSHLKEKGSGRNW